jgi:hypothetical protein
MRGLGRGALLVEGGALVRLGVVEFGPNYLVTAL